jgi:hypothetical protein
VVGDVSRTTNLGNLSAEGGPADLGTMTPGLAVMPNLSTALQVHTRRGNFTPAMANSHQEQQSHQERQFHTRNGKFTPGMFISH